MGALLVFLFVVAIILMIVTLVGHGIWVLLAAIFAAGREKPARTCPFCRRSTPLHHDRCDWCGKEFASLLAKELSDLEVVRRQLLRFREKGTLTPKVADRLLRQLQDYRQQLLHPAVVKRAAPIVAAAELEAAVPDRPAAAPPVLPPAMPRPEAVTPPAPQLIAEPQAATEAQAPPYGPTVLPHLPAVPVAAVKPQPPAPPSRSWTEVLAAFMEQRNIRWGELIGGLLFVCSSVALVVSLWETLERIPYSKFFIFVSISSAVFGVGLYAHHRWKLESTSRALLVIATLLVPLNFVAMASMAKGEWTLLTLVSEFVSLAIFAYLVGLAARILVPDGRWLISAAVIGDSIAVLLAAQLVRADSPAWLMVGTGALPVALFAGAVGCYLYSRFERANWRPLRLTDAQIGFVFTLLGVTAFSTVVALGLLVARAVTPLDVAIVLQRLSVLLAVSAVPILASGLTVMRGSQRDKDLAAYHLAGTVVALVAMLVMLAALGLAWPTPGWLIAVAVLNTMVLVFAAFRWRLPVLHTGAIACAALAYLATFYLLTGKLTSTDADPYGVHLLQLMISAQSGTALAGLFLVLAAVSEYLVRLGRHRHGVVYFGGCGVVAVAGLLLVTAHGVRTGGADALRAAILYAVYSAGSLALTARWRRLVLGYLGLILVASAALWAMWSAAHHVGPLWGAVLAIEAIIMVLIAAVLHRYAAGAWYDPWIKIEEDRFVVSWPRSTGLSLVDLYRIPLAHLGEAAAMLAAALTVWTAWFDRALIFGSPTPAPIVASAAIAAVYFLLAWFYRSPARTWVASSVVLAGAIHALNFNYFQCIDHIGPNWTIAILGHATLAMLAVLCLDRLYRAKEVVRQAIGDPLADSALLSSVLATPVLIFGRSAGSLWLACCFPWLAAVWLVLARRRRSVVLFAAHQTALAFAVMAAATAWMKYVGWIVPAKLPPAPNLLERIASVRHVVLEPRNLQVYGIALGLLSLIWVVARIIDLHRGLPSPFGRGRAPCTHGRGEGSSDTNSLHPSLLQKGEEDLNNGSPHSLLQGELSVDGCIRHGVVVMQWWVVTLCMLAEVHRELVYSAVTPAMSATVPIAFGPTAWILLGILAVMLVATLWERWRTAELVAMLLVAATLPCLIAGRFAADLAVASAARWTLAIGFVVCSIAVWRRVYLADVCRRVCAGPFVSLSTAPQPVGWDKRSAGPPSEAVTSLRTGRRITSAIKREIILRPILSNAPRVARGILLATMVLPVLAITVMAAMLQIGGVVPGGPVTNTFFATLGPTRSYLVPLALVIAALVGHALRERSSGYAFFAGMVLEMAVLLGYALHATLAKQPFDATFGVTLIQLFAITAAVWAIAWIIARKRFDVWREQLPSPSGSETTLPAAPWGEASSSRPLMRRKSAWLSSPTC